MNNQSLAKNIWEKLRLWKQNFKRKKKLKYKKITPKKKYLNNKNMLQPINRIDLIYPKISCEELNILHKIINNIEPEKDINKESIPNYNNIHLILNEKNIYVNQLPKIKKIITKTKEKINRQTEKNNKRIINNLKDNIEKIINEKITEDEKYIIKKAYLQYDKVNYIICTTMIIDEITNEISQIQEDINNNKYTIYEIKQKIQNIENRINELQIINNRNEVIKEITQLKNDFYTKKKDKYDLLYNNEVFINLEQKCEEIINKLNNGIKEENKDIQIKEKINIKEKENIIQKQEEEKKEKFKKELQEQENILKRFMDLQLAHNIILKQEENYIKYLSFDLLTNAYNNFIIGEQQKFNFSRNKTKTEIVKLYNQLNYLEKQINNEIYVPLEHINIKLEPIIHEIIIKKSYIELYFIKKKINIKNIEINTLVDDKLNNILIEENKKNNKEKQLVKIYNNKDLKHEK